MDVNEIRKDLQAHHERWKRDWEAGYTQRNGIAGPQLDRGDTTVLTKMMSMSLEDRQMFLQDHQILERVLADERHQCNHNMEERVQQMH